MHVRATTLLALAVLAFVGVTVAGPLNPPAGPVAPTDPDLGQILNAVQGGEDCCGNVRGRPGVPLAGSLILNGIASSPVLEHDFAIERLGSSVRPPELSVVRAPDGSSAAINEALLRGTFVDGSLTVGDASGVVIEFTRAQIVEASYTQVATCDGVRTAEEITLLPTGVVRYIGPNLTVVYDFITGMVTTE